MSGLTADNQKAYYKSYRLKKVLGDILWITFTLHVIMVYTPRKILRLVHMIGFTFSISYTVIPHSLILVPLGFGETK